MPSYTNLVVDIATQDDLILPTYTYNNGTAGVGATLTFTAAGILTIDGINVVLNNRLLIKGQNSGGPENGLYLCTTEGTVSTAAILTRTTDWDTLAKLNTPGMIYVKTGTKFGDHAFQAGSNQYTAIGSNGITFTAPVNTPPVAYADCYIGLVDNTDANVSTTTHGFAPKLPNDNTKFLDGTGAYTVPAGTPGSMVLIATATASNSATISFTGLSLSGYSHLTLVATSVIPITDNVQLYLRFSTGGTFDSGTNYLVNDFRFTNTASGIDGNGSLTAIPLTGVNEVLGTAANASVNTKVTIYEPNTGTYKYINGEWCGRMHSGTFLAGVTGAYWANTGAIDGIRILCASGNISSGKFALYGVKNS